MQSSPGPFILQCLLGCAGVSAAQHNYSLFWCVVLSSTVFRLCSVVFCYIFFSCSSPLVSPLVWFLPLFPAVDPCSVADFLVFLFFCFIMFELTAEAVTK